MSRSHLQKTPQQEHEAGLKRLATGAFVAAVASLGISAALVTHNLETDAAKTQGGQGQTHPAHQASIPSTHRP